MPTSTGKKLRKAEMIAFGISLWHGQRNTLLLILVCFAASILAEWLTRRKVERET